MHSNPVNAMRLPSFRCKTCHRLPQSAIVVAASSTHMHSRTRARACARYRSVLRCAHMWFLILTNLNCVCRVADYWEGYKLFCYAYYEHYFEHESEFEQSKLGSFFSFAISFCASNLSTIYQLPGRWAATGCRLPHCFHILCLCAGCLVWRRLVRFPPPSHHAIRTTCMQILHLVEMYYKWELQEDCSDLGALMRRFDCESDLESNFLGRSLLHMIRDDDAALPDTQHHNFVDAQTNPFNAVRERLAIAELAIQELRPQVQPPPHGFLWKC